MTFKKIKYRRLDFYKVYICVYLLMIAICAKSEELINNGVIIPFIRINQAYPLLVILLFGVGYIFYKKLLLNKDVKVALFFLSISYCYYLYER